MAETISKMVIEIGGKEYEFSGGGTPAPQSVGKEQLKDNSVGTDAIEDGSIETQDLSEDVQSKIKKTYYEDDESLHMDFDNAVTEP